MVACCISELQTLSKQFCSSCGKICLDKNTQVPQLKLENGQLIQGLATIAKYIIRKGAADGLLGSNREDRAAIDQWLEYRVTRVDRCANEKEVHTVLQELNSFLASRTFMVNQHLTIADVMLCSGLHCIFETLTFFEKQKYINLSRWFNQVQHETSLGGQQIHFLRERIYTGKEH